MISPYANTIFVTRKSLLLLKIFTYTEMKFWSLHSVPLVNLYTLCRYNIMLHIIQYNIWTNTAVI